MRSLGTVLVLTQWFDPTADMVVEELNRRGVSVFRCDPGDLPQHLTFAAELGEGWAGSLRLDTGRALDLAEVGCAYYRRPTGFGYPTGLTEADQRWASRESLRGLGGVLQLIPCWLNHPAVIGRAEYKPIQLDAAHRVGLELPRTLITNDAERAATFAAELGGQVVYKSLSSSIVHGTDGEAPRILYSTPVSVGQLGRAGIRLATHLFQELVPKACELRVTYVDGHLFVARIDAGSDAGRTDWRADYQNLTYSVAELPPPVADAIGRLMDDLGLRFGALDLVVTPDGRHVFLEVNPNGQWGWIEDATGLPIAAAIADALTDQQERGDHD
ncbi:ATP-grasp ribosomal peptide maturase [Actinocatenispora thailandica]|uniref:ATP-grasp ribosomal peptide maturase n=1 Tax=Actinocatenispora thailandica TaxID=227318 RepID=A0A7R7DJ26_9ACTN|nr:ATP-grasp ribosomal peptide maturase [Actinocatenispora thailandica]BCJ32535.1 ATP-grasp ribosomal peptide maturase [Actinocatenispora thailandica]